MIGSNLLFGAIENFCTEASEILELVGWVLTIFKVAIPLIIIALGLFDLGKAAISSKPEEIKKSAISIVWRLVGGIAIFFIPSLIMMVFGWIGGFNDAKSSVTDWEVCYKCVVSPWDSKCTG